MTCWMRQGAACAATALLAATLAACGGGSDHAALGPAPGTGAPAEPPAPKVQVDELVTGAYAVSTGNADKPTLGRYYAGADGRRLLALEDTGESLALLARRTDSAADWVAVPQPTVELNVALLRSQSRTLATPDAAALAGRYVVRLADGSAADFRIGADGRIAAGTLPGCQLSGSLAGSSTLPGTLALALDSAGCAGLPAHAAGVLVVDTLDAPASLRLLADDGARTVDLRGYAEPAV